MKLFWALLLGLFFIAPSTLAKEYKIKSCKDGVCVINKVIYKKNGLKEGQKIIKTANCVVHDVKDKKVLRCEVREGLPKPPKTKVKVVVREKMVYPKHNVSLLAGYGPAFTDVDDKEDHIKIRQGYKQVFGVGYDRRFEELVVGMGALTNRTFVFKLGVDL